MKFRNKEPKERQVTPASNSQPLQVERIDSSRAGKDKIVVRVQGKWQGRRGAGEGRALLVIDADGQRQRFPAILQPQPSTLGRHGAWSASFALPAELEPRLSSGAVLWVDNVAMPLPGGVPAAAGEASVPEPAAQSAEREDPDREEHPGPVSTLRSELAQRAATEARLRGELAEVRAELQVRAGTEEGLEGALAQLREELGELREMVERSASMAQEHDRLAAEAVKLREQLDASQASREAAVREAQGLRAELERLAGELAGARVQGGIEDSAVQEAEALLAEARELKTRMGRRQAGPVRKAVGT